MRERLSRGRAIESYPRTGCPLREDEQTTHRPFTSVDAGPLAERRAPEAGLMRLWPAKLRVVGPARAELGCVVRVHVPLRVQRVVHLRSDTIEVGGHSNHCRLKLRKVDLIEIAE